MSKKTMNFCYLYPDSFNLHGDRGNVFAFEKTAKLLDIDMRFQKIDSFGDKIDFDKIDVLFVSPGELRTCQGIAETITKKADNFKSYIESGKTMIVIGTTIALFAKETKRLDGTIFQGLGLVDAICKERKITYSNDEVFTTDVFGDSIEIIGSQIQMIDVYLNGETPLGKVSYGYGNCHKDDEGILKNHFYFLNTLGPVFVKNPWLAANIISEALDLDIQVFDETYPAFSLEHKSNDEIRKFIDLKIRNYDKTRLEK